MITRIYILATLLLGCFFTRAEETNSVAHPTQESDSTSFEAFKIITQRNIFDPNRSAPGQRRRDEEKPKPIRIDYLNLLGAMSYDKGQFAFFDGTSSDYRKSVKAGDSIAGYKVAEVTQNRVTLTKDDKKIELPVGGQLKRQDEGEWQVNAIAENFSAAAPSTNSTGAPTSSSTSTNKSDSNELEMPDALKRLLERRKQEK